jgi:hypothetical protein
LLDRSSSSCGGACRHRLGGDRFWPARVAGPKGHSFFLYLLFSLVFFPAALIVAYVVPDRTAMMTA